MRSLRVFFNLLGILRQSNTLEAKRYNSFSLLRSNICLDEQHASGGHTRHKTHWKLLVHAPLVGLHGDTHQDKFTPKQVLLFLSSCCATCFISIWLVRPDLEQGSELSSKRMSYSLSSSSWKVCSLDTASLGFGRGGAIGCENTLLGASRALRCQSGGHRRIPAQCKRIMN